jgi:hypothetical protein
LIMVVVFLAVPALQRSQRNNGMKSVANRVMAELDNYASNNAGAYPTTAALFGNTAAGTCPAAGGTTFTSRYLANQDINDPRAGSCVGLAVASNTTASTLPANGPRTLNVHAGTGFQCQGENVIAGGAGRNIAITVALEGGAQYCLDNH